MESPRKPASQRPLSPHLQVYRWQITMVMSILHRASGVALAVAAFAVSGWLLAVAGGGTRYGLVHGWLTSPVGLAAVSLAGLALLYHWLNGIRHLLWDVGWGFEIPRVYRSGYTVWVLFVVLGTGLLWLLWRPA
jgi:succinate dehydrogenase / fumarate reductase cytochrome b subunit